MNYNKSIAKKLFLITSVIFAFFVLSTLIAQTVFFQNFYIYKKKSDLGNSLKKFKSAYVNLKTNQDVAELISQYENNFSRRIFIIDEAGRIKYVLSSGNEREDMGRLRVIYDISAQINQWNLMEDIRQSGRIKTYLSEKSDIRNRNIISIAYLSDRGEYIVFTDSLQPVNEAVNVISEIYIYFFAGAIILIIGLSKIYSNMMSKPLLEINKAALKMANLDFEEKCEVGSEDEIGSLALSLNTMSENLKNALNSLREANEKLQNDIEMERKLERMRKEFVAAVSHELKTPINLIEGYAEGLKDNIFEDKDKEFYLDVIIDESEKMGNLVEDMLDLSQLESGSFKLVKEEFFLHKLVAATVKKFSGLMAEKRINLNINLLENSRVYADWNRIEQVIINYITNAIRHTRGEGTIEVNMKDSGEEFIVEVINTGSRIPENELENIWDKFYKIDKSRNRELGGTGIGLAIVKNIVQLHEGKLGVENLDNGVKFYFSLKKLS